METYFTTALLIHIGALFYIVAFLIRDEMKLRLLVLSGSIFYLLYYYLFPDVPLWDAILTTVILTLANLIVLFRIALERSVLALSLEEKQLFAAFEGFTPGQFRQLLKIAEWRTAQSSDVLTTENEPLSKLYYIFEGSVHAKKGKHEFTLAAGNFIGEIAFVLKGPPTANVSALANTRYVEWNSAEIERLMAKSSSFENAMMALLSRDLADKLATSIQPGSVIV
ncbi:Crp/Fnr family transcriptional regulator [Parasphingorhabdus cellanae]|uniref:Cyclic nucleotide-binding domain-containing protein n=1 Tax=Parasphingorhabdus cellanae TaxID=2806553 RepID=A0ABX7T907_9SPHN|nr:cyclic nucleotide-binding domain-containing protein [Parasphingorhabdus cellanae]QTD56775.1 cyclic nucleotide-binding domain-containing protein [Parasphingorhabdus cellanae]